MSGALYIPGADRTSRWFLDDFPDQFLMPRIDKDLLHSTETDKRSGCPGYQGGATAPQVTINPWKGYRKIWQHLPIPRAGRALGNPSSTPVSENKDNVFQVEIIGYSDPGYGKARGCYLPELDDEGLQYIADMLIFVHKEWPHPTTLPTTWPLYKVSSWAAMDAAHMSSAQYDAHRGMLAHLHAPKPSSHGDVAIKAQTLKKKVDFGLLPPAPAGPTPAEEASVVITKTDTEDIFTRHAIMKDPLNPTGDRKTPSYVIEFAANQSLQNSKDIKALKTSIDALTAAVKAQNPPA